MPWASLGGDTRPPPGRGRRDTLGEDQQGAPRRCHQDTFGAYQYSTPRRCHQDTHWIHEHLLGDTTPAPPGHFLSGGPRYPPKALPSLFPQQELTPRAAARPQLAAEPQSHQGPGPLAHPHPSTQLHQTESVPVRNSSPDLQPGAVTKSTTPASLMGKAAWCWPPSRPKQGELLNLSWGFGRAAVSKAVSLHAHCNADGGRSPSVARVWAGLGTKQNGWRRRKVGRNKSRCLWMEKEPRI